MTSYPFSCIVLKKNIGMSTIILDFAVLTIFLHLSLPLFAYDVVTVKLLFLRTVHTE
jgi:hypothetical protein